MTKKEFSKHQDLQVIRFAKRDFTDNQWGSFLEFAINMTFDGMGATTYSQVTLWKDEEHEFGKAIEIFTEDLTKYLEELEEYIVDTNTWDGLSDWIKPSAMVEKAMTFNQWSEYRGEELNGFHTEQWFL